ncbi:MAG: translocation/assembly module TamB domain-containing protein [Acidobacteriota bacterium]|nr:translocation/assembly module TamB domain-containing protein [Acidobacteriota bacterium]
MADEENREPEEEIRDERDEQETNGDENGASQRWFSRRNLIILALIPLGLIVALIIAGFLAVRTGYVARYIERQFVVQLDNMGIRAEIGEFEQTFSPLGVEMRNVNLYDKITGEKLAFVRRLKLDATVTDLYALNLNRTVRLDSTEVEGLEAWVIFDEEGRTNFRNIKIPEQEESNLRFNFNTMKFAVRDSVVHYGDRRYDLTGDARNVALFLETEAGVSESEREVENRRFRFDLTATNSTLTYQSGKPVEPIDIRLRGVATESYADIEELNLKSPIANTTLTGRLEDWENLKYRLNVQQANVDLQQAGEIIKSESALRGIGNFVGTIEGGSEDGNDRYAINGEIQSDAIAVDNIRLRGLRADASVVGANETYEANGKAVAELLTFGDFQLNLMQVAGQVMGTGTDFRWLGELQAASARFPDGNVTTLILNDAVAEYNDGRLEATFGSASAGTLEAFDARVRGGRASNVRIRNTDAGTDATIGTVRADSVVREDLNLRSITASNVRIRDRESTNVEIGSLQAGNLQTEGANLQNITAGGVTINTRGDAVSANAETVTAANVTAEGANIRDLRARDVDVENIGNTTNVIAANLQIGGLRTAQASLGSLNIAGVRLRVVGERIEGSSGDINAGTVTLARTSSLPEGGTLSDVRLARPVFVVEPSGRYRASMDLSLGGGAVGSLNIGAARASVVASSSEIQLSNLNAQVVGGAVRGDVNLALGNRATSRINAVFENLDVAKILTLTGGQVVPVAGTATGNVDLTFPGTNFRAASGTLNADFAAEAGRDETNRVPLTGTLAVRATNGLFDIETARFNTQNTEVTASGRFDLEGANSNLQVALNSTDAKELQRLIAALDVAPTVDRQLAENRIELAGNVSFSGTLTGNLTDPTINGRATLETLIANNRTLGSFSTEVLVSPAATELRNGLLAQADGGRVNFDLTAPRVGQNNIAINADLNRVDLGNILAAIPAESLPGFLTNVNAETSGRVELTGLPGAIRGRAEITAASGTIAGETFQNLEARVQFDGTVARIERFNMNFDQGSLTAAGTYDQGTERFDLTASAQNIPISKIRAFVGDSSAQVPRNINGVLNLTASGTGQLTDFSTFDINFEGSGRDIVIENRALGNIAFTGRTQNQQLTANLTADIGGQQQVATATLNFGDPNLPFRAETSFNNTDLAPLAALAQPEGTMTLGGRATGTATFGGNLRQRNANGELVFSTENLRGTARFSQLTLQVENVVLSATDPLLVSFSTSRINFDSTRFTGSGSDLVISGTAFFAGEGTNNLSVEGRINLGILNSVSPNQFFAGFANISARVTGTTAEPRFAGSASLENAAFATLVSNSRISLSNLNGQILFNSNQVQIPSLEGRLGGGRVVASGGAVLEGFALQSFRLSVRGDDVGVPLPPDFRTSGDVDLQIGGRTENGVLNTRITGDIFADRISYTRDINLADFLSQRQAASLTQGGGVAPTGGGTTRIDLRVEGRDALVVRNNVADIVGSISLRVTGDASEPIIAGRISVTSGTVVLLNDQRYDIQRATVDFPGELDASPIINVQAESDIGGYQVFLGASGPIAEPESLNVTLRSNPGLPQADVVSLVTTGNLTNTEGGIPSLAQTGINTAAGVLTENIINAPIRRATDRLFGLNRFEIDPVLAGQRGINPGARLTVGRQINRNLLITYSTNLSADQNQILALEYRVSNRLSFVAQYEQASLTNVTGRRDNFSFEVRFRRRF